MNVVRFVLYFFIALLILPPCIKAEEDQVYFKNKEGEKIENPIVYVGEKEIYFRVIFGNNCCNYSVEVCNPLFLYSIHGMNPIKITIGERDAYPLNINPNAPVGKYLVTIYLNYTLENNIKVYKRFNFTVEYKRSFELINLKLPNEHDKTFSLKVQTFTEFDKLHVRFDKDGDILLEKEEIVLENISTGNYTFKTKVWQQNELFPAGGQELGYDITGYIDDHMIYKGDANIPVKITWFDEKTEQEQTARNNFISFGIVILMVIIIGVFYYNRYRRKK